jgi:hypothetical protein
MDTDYLVPTEVDRIRARVAKPVDGREVTTWERTFDVGDVEGQADVYTLPATFSVVPDGADVDGEIIVELFALAAGSDSVLVSRKVRTGFIRGQAVLLRMLLYRDCTGRTCDSGQSCGCPDASACVQPSCVDESVSPEMLEPIQNTGSLPANSEFPTDGGSTGGSGGGTGGSGGSNCTPPLEVCRDECVNTQSDPRYCGDCQTACPTGFVCEGGQCSDPGDCTTNDVGCEGFTYCEEESGRCLRGCSVDEQCPRDFEVCDLETRECVCSEGYSRCAFECVETDTDPRFCGSCETSCVPGFVCESGVCIDPGDCRINEDVCVGFTYCDPGTGRCLFGCGTDTQCAGANQVCDLTSNECVCDVGFHECGAGCVSDLDVANCGDSCTPCPAPEGSTPTCNGVACGFVCDQGLTACGSSCADTQTDPRFCGDCLTQCPVGNECRAGVCFDPGDCRTNGTGCEGLTYCDPATGNCLDGCDRNAQCTGQNEVCNRLTNECECAAGFHDCGGVCVSDLDVASCGTRCTPCEAPEGSTATCEAGVCGFVCDELYEPCNDSCCLAGCPDGQVLFDGSCAAFHTRTADNQGNNGKFTSIQLDPSGVPHVAYYADSGKNLMFSIRTTQSAWTRETALAQGEVGKHASLARGPTGLWSVAFEEDDDQQLWFATRLSRAQWSVEVVDDSDDVGEYASLAFDSGGVPHIAYYDKGEKRLLLATRQAGGGWTRRVVDSSNDVGKYASLAFNASGVAHVAYYDESEKDLRIAVENGRGGWNIDEVDSNGNVGKFASLAFAPNGSPFISYYDESTKDLVVARRVLGTFWIPGTVDSADDVGRYTSIAFAPDGTAHVSYQDETNKDLKHASRTPSGSWAVQTVDSVGDVGEHTSITVDSEGVAHIAYYDKTGTNLKYAIVAPPE